MFDSPEDIERSIDIVGATFGLSTATYEVAIIITEANPTAGVVVWAAIGVVVGVRSLIRALQ